MENPYTAPQSEIVAPPPTGAPLEFAGFWIRFGAVIVDGLILTAITMPLLFLAYGSEAWEGERMIKGPFDFLISYIFPFFWVILFWAKAGATPGKMALKIKIVNADGSLPSIGQCIGRYFAYFLSALPLLLGYLWAAWDPKKQSWHDKLANTYVIRTGP